MPAETRLRIFTIVFLVIYAPVEIWYSLPALWDLFFLVDLTGMLLLMWGVVAMWRERRRAAAAILSAAYGWTGANFWRAASDRLYAVRDGVQLDYGFAEIGFTVCILLSALLGLVFSLSAAVRQRDTADRVELASRL